MLFRSHNIVDAKGLKVMVPAFDWPPYLAALGQARVNRFNVTEPAFLKARRPCCGWPRPGNGPRSAKPSLLRPRQRAIPQPYWGSRVQQEHLWNNCSGPRPP